MLLNFCENPRAIAGALLAISDYCGAHGLAMKSASRKDASENDRNVLGEALAYACRQDKDTLADYAKQRLKDAPPVREST